ncbi:hypothetical protein [Actinoplanes sp. NPDC049599]|uniref:hypothetical protein n=1 Tax=Actinoplanes sp. NPDC049599 TaxID=3363903 RepID=UPI0037B4B65A
MLVMTAMFGMSGGTVVTGMSGGTVVTGMSGGTVVTGMSGGTVVTDVTGGTVVTDVTDVASVASGTARVRMTGVPVGTTRAGMTGVLAMPASRGGSGGRRRHALVPCLGPVARPHAAAAARRSVLVVVCRAHLHRLRRPRYTPQGYHARGNVVR